MATRLQLSVGGAAACRDPPSRPLRLNAYAAVGGSVAESRRRQEAPVKVVETGLLGERRAAVALGGSTATPPPPTTRPRPTDVGGSNASGGEPAGGLLAAVRSFFLPFGWPHSVTPDYLAYQLATVPAHITGHMSHALATSSMIEALGIEAAPTTAAAVSAAIKWITKDGLGAAGRLIVGGRLSSVFDEDPRRWRMVAEGIVTAGLALEIATQIFPSKFVLLAGAGTLAKAMAKGMGTPCFRIIQTHFSATNNVGDVAAKEEVWEVVAQLVGLAASVVVLQLLESTGHPEAVVPVWAAVHAAHVWLRYIALSALHFRYPNQKRAALLALAHVRLGRVLSIQEANERESREQVFLSPSACSPRVRYGCTLHQALPSGGGASADAAHAASKAAQLAELVTLYRGERYMLTWHGGTAWVLVLENARRTDLLRAMWQAAWLDSYHQEQLQGRQQEGTDLSTDLTPSAHSRDASSPNGSRGGISLPNAGLLARSLEALEQQWPDFVAQAEGQGWELNKAVLPQGNARLRFE